MITVDRVYPLLLGSNIGTTTTAMLAALADGGKNSLQIALCHLFFNISGILIFYPIPFLRWPLAICKILGRTTARYRWFAIFYLFFMFFLLPGAIMALSLAGPEAVFGVLGPIAIVLTLSIVINVMQVKKPEWLPSILKNWNFLPLWMHSLEPIDKVLRTIGSTFCSCCSEKCKCLSVNPEITVDDNDSKPAPIDGQINYAFQEDCKK